MCVRVLRQNSPHSLSQLKQVLRIFPAWASRVDDLVGYLLEGRWAKVVGVVVRTNVEQCLARRGSEQWTGVKGHRNDLVTTFFAVVKVALDFLLPACRQLVCDAPNTALRILHQSDDPPRLARYPSVVGTALPKPTTEAFYITNSSVLIRKIHFPYQGAVTKDPHSDTLS